MEITFFKRLFVRALHLRTVLFEQNDLLTFLRTLHINGNYLHYGLKFHVH